MSCKMKILDATLQGTLGRDATKKDKHRQNSHLEDICCQRRVFVTIRLTFHRLSMAFSAAAGSLELCLARDFLSLMTSIYVATGPFSWVINVFCRI
jgi:hypothetical protein